MNWKLKRVVTSRPQTVSVKSDRSKIQALIDQATMDSNDESDEHVGLLGMIREEVTCPFQARVQGVEVECLRLEWPKKGYGLNAVCRTDQGKIMVVDIDKLEWIDPLPAGYEWIEAYTTWREWVG
jgi:hypothetical protein